jgi:hypothetical protein
VNIANIHKGSDKAMGKNRDSPKGCGQNRGLLCRSACFTI